MLPQPNEPVIELTLHRTLERMKADGHRPHEGHPVHEAAMCSPLPASLQILRLDGCRLRTWPQHLPVGLREFYAAQCDFFTFPDLSAYTNLIVIEMPDNRIERLTAPLPPTLARLNLDSNAVFEVRCAKPATLANAQFHNNPGLEAKLREEIRAHNRAVQAALAAQPPQVPPPAPPSAVPQWVAATAAPRVQINRALAAAVIGEAREVNPYKNDHNVHDSGIQDSTKANLTYLANYKPDVPPNKRLIEDIKAHLNSKTSKLSKMIPAFCHSIAADMGLTSLDIAKANGFSGPVVAKVVEELRIRLAQPYVMHGVMPAEIVDRLWLRIMDFEGETRNELVKRFCDEIIDAAAHCTNGFMVRMANVLIGYDENCVMKMRPTQIMQARVPATMARLRKKMVAEGAAEGTTEPWTFWRDCIVQTWEDMEEIDMEHKERGSWLTDLVYPLLPDLCKGIVKTMKGEPAPDGEGGDMVSYRLRLAIEDAKLNKPAKRLDPDREEPDLATYVRNEAMDYLPSKWKEETTS